MVEATRVFAEVNEAVRSQERLLRHDLHKDALADSLATLQKGEESKLRFTLIQQVCLDTHKGCSLPVPSLGGTAHFLLQSSPKACALGGDAWASTASRRGQAGCAGCEP